MKRSIFRLFQASIITIFGFAANSVFAAYGICLKKEISADGSAWYDANTQAEAVLITDTAFFRFTVSKCPDNPGGLNNIVLTDDLIGLTQSIEDLPHSTTEWPERIFTTQVDGYCDGQGYKENVAQVTALNQYGGEVAPASDNAWAMCEDIPTGGEGCTPGYWKQSQHFDSWAVDTNTTFAEVFGRSIEIRVKRQGKVYEPTLLEALNATGGQVNMAARHATAAYLNAMNSGVMFDITPASVIEAFQSSFDNDNYGVLIENLVNLNEQGCPLN
ncbi:hypothetical protein [Pleionea litopenaei]|uniref:Uncharacterized protein n=1 Tax=Pleionea litopenaei TaxID=3070815 RepID=A0AA51RSY5_9GAMM|nr:hypothetical protein [Pleionea sp. HL-JVS1]WMS86945.1 hypothetical protein Q9312_17145 [Pleionea sp. HL-JVS1]